MLRADIFSMLSVCQSNCFVDNLKTSRSIRRGLLELVKRTQDINDADETIPFIKGGDKNVILDKCLRNEASDVMTVNMPEHWELQRLRDKEEQLSQD